MICNHKKWDIYNVPVMFVGLFKNITNTIYVVSNINHSCWSYLHQLSYRLGAHFVPAKNGDFT
jgi:hypothetical protein